MKTQSDVAEITWKFRRFAKISKHSLGVAWRNPVRGSRRRSIGCVFIFVAEQTKAPVSRRQAGQNSWVASSEIFAPHLLQMLDTNFTNSPQLVEGS